MNHAREPLLFPRGLQRLHFSSWPYKTAESTAQQVAWAIVYYLEGDQLLGEDNEGTVDSSHPTDLGFMRQADAFEEALKPILGSQSKAPATVPR